jgi:hypothetical protein
MVGQRPDSFLSLRCGYCGETQDVSLCGNPGCPDRASACAGREGYCCRCFASAVTAGTALAAGRDMHEQRVGNQCHPRATSST